LHYLAESAGWLAARSTPLIPTPAAWLWLKAPRTDRIQTLWHTWTRPNPDRWRAYCLPGHKWLTDPAPLLAAIHRWLPHLDPTDPAAFARALLDHQSDAITVVPPNLHDPVDLLTTTIVDLLTGPLTWLGTLWKDEGGRRKDENNIYSSLIPHPSSFDSPSAKFTLTTNLQSDPRQSALTLTPEPGLPEPVDLVVAIEIGDRDEAVTGKQDEASSEQNAVSSERNTVSTYPLNTAYSPLNTAYSLRVTAVSFIRALHRGWAAPELIDAVNRLAHRPLIQPELDLLQSWVQAAQRMRIYPCTLLESADPNIITRLASTRRGRPLIHRTHSPRVVEIDPAKVDQLARRLTEQEGVPPKDEGGGMRDERTSSFRLLPSSCLWLAVQVYQQLGQHIKLPARIPQTLLDQLAQQLTETDIAAANIAAAQTLAALQQILDGSTPYPVWFANGLPEAESLAVIETALFTGQNLKLHYYTAGTDTLTRRVVEPYRLEWRGDTPYLVGFCHRAQAERVFRLDRIQEIELIPAEPA
jgi:hypothetical protein